MRRCVMVLVWLLLAVSAAAQMPSTVLADRVLIGDQFVPRFLDLPVVKQVPAGEIWTPDADSTWDYLEVAGVLACDRTRDTVLRVTTLIVMPGGELNCGLDGYSLGPDRKVEIIISATPIDLARDPFQWGNGVLIFGRWDSHGAAKLEWTTTMGDITAGATTFEVKDDPIGWRVGDEIISPDMLSSRRREGRMFVSEIAGRLITTSKPFDFAHNRIVRPDGALVLMPRVANLTRNIVIRSESQTVPGHVAIIGHDAVADVRFTSFESLGRTRNVPLNNTTADLTEIGTNQIARYALHWHHVMHGLGSAAIGNVLRGCGPMCGKWGGVIHASHDVVFERNIAIDFGGSGFVTEDGYEVRTSFVENFAAYNVGNPKNSDGGLTPGTTGNGIWARGTQGTFLRNESWDNNRGINLFAIQQVRGKYPSVPGGEPDTTFDRTKAQPLAFAENVGAANLIDGFEYWGVPPFPNVRPIGANNGGTQLQSAIAAPAGPRLVDPIFVAPEGSSARCIESPAAYTETFEMVGGYLGGCSFALSGGGGRLRTLITGTTIQTSRGLDWSAGTPTVLKITDATFLPLGARPPQYIAFGSDTVWSGTLPLPPTGRTGWVPQRGSQATIENWQGTGKNYQLFHLQQRADFPAWPSIPGVHAYNCPEASITMGDCWDRYGMSFRGDVVRAEDAVPLVGLTKGLAREGLVSTLGPPRTILTSPTLRDNPLPALNGQGYLVLNLVETGDFTTPYTRWRTVIDDVQINLGAFADSHVGVVWTKHLEPGIHTVRTYRVTPTGDMLAGSEMTFQYQVTTP